MAAWWTQNRHSVAMIALLTSSAGGFVTQLPRSPTQQQQRLLCTHSINRPLLRRCPSFLQPIAWSAISEGGELRQGLVRCRHHQEFTLGSGREERQGCIFSFGRSTAVRPPHFTSRTPSVAMSLHFPKKHSELPDKAQELSDTRDTDKKQGSWHSPRKMGGIGPSISSLSSSKAAKGNKHVTTHNGSGIKTPTSTLPGVMISGALNVSVASGNATVAAAVPYANITHAALNVSKASITTVHESLDKLLPDGYRKGSISNLVGSLSL